MNFENVDNIWLNFTSSVRQCVW